jgi:hypothetical protein
MTLQPVDGFVHRRELQSMKFVPRETILVGLKACFLAVLIVAWVTPFGWVRGLSLPAAPEAFDLLLVAVSGTTRSEHYRP